MVTIEGVNPNMIANNLEPFYNAHPGEVLKDEIAFRGISQRDLAKHIGVPASQLNEMLNGKRKLNTELAMLLSAALDLDAASLLKMQMEYNILEAKRNPGFMQRVVKLADWARELRKIAAVF